jgi:hypothetical protein
MALRPLLYWLIFLPLAALAEPPDTATDGLSATAKNHPDDQRLRAALESFKR